MLHNKTIHDLLDIKEIHNEQLRGEHGTASKGRRGIMEPDLQETKYSQTSGKNVRF